MWTRFLALAAAFFLVGGQASAQTAGNDALSKIGHIVVIFEENRSFDNMFGLFPDADGLQNAGEAARQTDLDGKPYDFLPSVMNTNAKPPLVDARFPARIANGPFPIDPYVPQTDPTGDLVHRFYQEQMQIDGGKMDRYAAVSDAGGLVMGYYDLSKTEHWRLASEYALGDAMFHSAFGGSFLNHTFLVCGCAFRWPNAPEKIVVKLDADGHMVKDGQVTPDGFAVNTSRSVFLHAPTDTNPEMLVPPQTMPHIGDRLDEAGVSWAWYSGGYDAAAAGRPSRLFQFHHQPLAYFADLAPGTPGQRAHLKDRKDLDADIANDTLPQVVFYKPIGEDNLHPGYATIRDGDVNLAQLVSALQASPAYKDMLIIVTVDENGGFWDHVPPPKRDAWGPGTRIPVIAIGPTVKRHFIDHTTYDFNSILRTIELRFGARPLHEADAQANPMTNLLQE
jgi:phospholipase C